MTPDPRGKKWFILLSFTGYPYGSEFLYHGMQGEERDGWYSYEDHGETPMSIERIGPFVPPLADIWGPGLVVSEEVRNAIKPLGRTVFLPVKFTKMVRLDWQPGDTVPHNGYDEPEQNIIDGANDPGLIEGVGRYYEMIVSSLRLWMKQRPGCGREASRTFRVRKWQVATTDRDLERPWVDSYFQEVDICDVGDVARIVSNVLLERLEPFLDPKWFKWIPWSPDEGVLDLDSIMNDLYFGDANAGK